MTTFGMPYHARIIFKEVPAFKSALDTFIGCYGLDVSEKNYTGF